MPISPSYDLTFSTHSILTAEIRAHPPDVPLDRRHPRMPGETVYRIDTEYTGGLMDGDRVTMLSSKQGSVLGTWRWKRKVLKIMGQDIVPEEIRAWRSDGMLTWAHLSLVYAFNDKEWEMHPSSDAYKAVLSKPDSMGRITYHGSVTLVPPKRHIWTNNEKPLISVRLVDINEAEFTEKDLVFITLLLIHLRMVYVDRARVNDTSRRGGAVQSGGGGGGSFSCGGGGGGGDGGGSDGGGGGCGGGGGGDGGSGS